MDVLDLPMKRQLELAELMGQSHEEWVEETKNDFKKSAEFLKKLYEIEKSGGRMSEEQRKLFQAKMDSGNPR